MDKIAAAFVKAQAAFAPALKTNTNPHFKSRYVGLDGCIEAVIDALNSNGIALIQPTRECDKGVTVETLFIHESGQTMSGGVLHVPASKEDPQGYGSALTYARRYSLMAACGIAPEDDDGNAASRPRQDQRQDFDARKIAATIEIAVASGKAAEEAQKLFNTDHERREAIKAFLTPETRAAIRENWPA
jgi:hypothetical protein